MKIKHLLSISILFSSCETRFLGSAHVSPQQCKQMCREWGMELDAMVGMGEYTSGCVCRVQSKRRSRKKVTSSEIGSAVGVFLQTKLQQQRRQHQQPGMY